MLMKLQNQLVQEDSFEISRILETTQNEMAQRVSGEVDNREKILAELKAITKLRAAKNYLNLKIRQRFWVMNFYNSFEPVGKEIRHVATPGAMSMDLINAPYQHRDDNFWPRTENPHAKKSS